MTSIKELRKESFKIHRNNGLYAYLVYFVCGLLVGGICLLTIFSPFIVVILTPLLILPILFTADTLVGVLKENSYISLGSFFRSFIAFFSNRFNSVYGFWKAVLKALIITVGFGLIYSIVINSVIFSVNEAFKQLLLEFQSLLLAPEEAAIQAFIDKYSYELTFISIVNYVPLSIIFVIAFAFSTSFNSLIYFFMFEPKNLADGQGCRLVHSQVIRNNHKFAFKAYFGLNYPMIAFYILTSGLGAYIGYLVKFDLNYILAFSTAIPMFLTTFIFGSLFYSNRYVTYLSLKPQYLEIYNGFGKDIMDNLLKALEKIDKEKGRTKKDSDESDS